MNVEGTHWLEESTIVGDFKILLQRDESLNSLETRAGLSRACRVQTLGVFLIGAHLVGRRVQYPENFLRVHVRSKSNKSTEVARGVGIAGCGATLLK